MRGICGIGLGAALWMTAQSPAVAEEIWVTNEKDDTISVIDVATLKVTRTIPTGERPRGITFGQNLIARGGGVLRVGDAAEVLA